MPISDKTTDVPEMRDNNSDEILKEAAKQCFSEAKQKKSIGAEMIKRYLEPVFIDEGYRNKQRCGQIENILIIRLDEIGDNTLTSGFIRELRKNYPKAYITLIVNPVVAPLVELCPYVNEVVSFPVSSELDIISRFYRIAKLCYERLWKKRYDMAFLPRWDIDSAYAAFLAYFSGARERVGYSANVSHIRKNGEPYIDGLLTRAIVNPPNMYHEVERNFYLLRALNLQVNDYSLELWYDVKDYKRVEKPILEFSEGRKIIAVAAGSNLMSKNYPPEKLAVALNKIKNPDNCFILLGGKSEKEIGEYLQKNLSDPPLDLTGATSLRETAAALKLCSMFIGMDTSSMHMAAAQKLPIIEINCAPLTREDSPFLTMTRFKPWQTPSIIVRPKKPLPPCDELIHLSGCAKLNESHCISQIPPEDIVAAYENLNSVVLNK